MTTPDCNSLRLFDGIAHKGEIWNIEQGESTPTGTEIWANRPAIIVSNEATNTKAGFVNVVFLTTSNKRPMPYHVNVKSGDKMATALCEQIFAIDKSRISFYIGKISSEEMLEIDKALLFSLGISNSIRPNSLFDKWMNTVNRYNINLNDDINSPNETHTDIAKERDMYKILYEQEKHTVTKLMSLSSI